MRNFKFIPIAGIIDEKTRARITKALRNTPLNEGAEYGRKGRLNWFRIEKIERMDDGRVFTLMDRRGAPYVIKIQNGFLVERLQKGELKTREELAEAIAGAEGGK